MSKSTISLQFYHGDEAYLIPGLQLVNIETNNSFWRSNTVSDCASYVNTVKSSVSLELRGIFISNQEQLLLQDLAFGKKFFNGLFKHEKFEISGEFNIQRYQLSNKVDEIDCFDLQLICQNKIMHKMA